MKNYKSKGESPIPTTTKLRTSGEAKAFSPLKGRGVATTNFVAKEALKKGQEHIVYLLGVVEYNFKLWTHLQDAPETKIIDD